MITLKTLIINAPAELRDTLDGIRGRISLMRHVAALRPGEISSPTASAKVAMRALARRWRLLHEEIHTLEQELDRLVHEKAPELMKSHGISTITVAEMLISWETTPSASSPKPPWPSYAASARSLRPAARPTGCV